MQFQANNNTLIQSAFEAMRGPLSMFEMREFIRKYQDRWWSEGVHGHLFEDQRRDVAPVTQDDDMACIDSLDILLLFRLVIQSWKDVFVAVLDRRSQTWCRELIDTRNAWAHSTGGGFTDEDTARALDTMARLMEQIDPETATAIRDRYRELVSRDQVTAAQAEPGPQAGSVVVPANPAAEILRPWRQVVAPKDDVARGRFKTAEFALDLATVAKGDAAFEYQDPKEFFSRTYITEGMRSLIVTALRRVSVTDDDGGDPVVELKTAFGGGKTHSMLALYHIMRNSNIARDLPGIAEVMGQAGVPSLPDKVYVATLVGTDLDPSSSKNPAFLKGKVNTLWGEMAYQLCLQKGDPEPYAIIRSADSKSVAPGTDALVRFFNAIGPCVVLMDEFIVYARNLYGNDDKKLPAGTFANVLSFVQQLTEAVKRTENCMLVASLPMSARELGDEGGEEALERVSHVFARINTIWRAANNEEGFEIVKRRLFKDYDARLAEPVVDAFMEYYKQDPDKFPIECRDAAYRDRMLRCYPIHPQVFDRLYEDWSTLDKFQRTRGVLRFMATVIYNLWEANDADPLIMPGSIDFADGRVLEEIFQYLDPAWNAVVDSDVDGPGSTPALIDKNNGRFSRPRAARRVARTIFLGSAPSGRGESMRGLDTSDIRLGAAVPGTGVTVYDDALNKMSDELSYLYNTGIRYWYDTHPTIDKLARDRASRLDLGHIDARVVKILQDAERTCSSGFSRVHVCPESSVEVPDEATLGLVVIPPSKTYDGRDAERSAARVFAEDCLTAKGQSLRVNRNMLLFTAAGQSDLSDAREAVRRYLAWESISDEAERLELTRAARTDVSNKLATARDRARRLVLEAYRHLLVPAQDASDLKSVDWDVLSMQGSEPVSIRAFDRAVKEEAVLKEYSPYLLGLDMHNLLWGNRDHVPVSELAADYEQYCYLRRFANEGVLLESIASGVARRDQFAYADGYDDENRRYIGLMLGERPIVSVRAGLVVRRERALEQLAFDSEGNGAEGGSGTEGGSSASGNGGDVEPGEHTDPLAEPPTPQLPTEVSLEMQLDKLTAGYQVGTVVEEILQQLYDIGAVDAELSFSAYVTVPEGIPEGTQRAIRENANALGVTIRLD